MGGERGLLHNSLGLKNLTFILVEKRSVPGRSAGFGANCLNSDFLALASQVHLIAPARSFLICTAVMAPAAWEAGALRKCLRVAPHRLWSFPQAGFTSQRTSGHSKTFWLS